MTLGQIWRALLARAWLVAAIFVVVVVGGVLFTLSQPHKYRATVSVVLDSSEPVMGTVTPTQFASGYLATQVDIIASAAVARRVAEDLRLASNPAAQERFIAATDGRGRIEDWLAQALLRDMSVVPSRESRVIDISFESLDPKFSAEVANAFAKAYIETNLRLSVEPARESAEWFDRQLGDLRQRVQDSQQRLAAYQKEHGIVDAGERLDIESGRLAEFSLQLAKAQVDAQNAGDRVRQMEALLASGADPNAIPDVLANNFVQTLKSQLVLQEAKLNDVKQTMGRNHPEFRSAESDVRNLRSRIQAEMRTIMSGMRNEAELAAKRETELLRAVETQKDKVLELGAQRGTLPALLREVESAQRAYDAALARFNDSTLQSRVKQTNVAVLTPATEPSGPSSPRPLLNLSVAVFLGLFLGINAALAAELIDRRIRAREDLETALGVPVLATVATVATARQVRSDEEGGVKVPVPITLPTPRRSVGQMLLASGHLSLDELVAVLSRQRARGERFGDAAVALGLVSREDLRHTLARQFGYPYLRKGEGGYPAELVAAFNPFSPPVEALRLLRTRLLLRWFEEGHRVLAIVAPQQGAGRSFLAANLAVVLAQLGKRTLIVDADLRGGRLHTLFKVNNDGGLVGLLSGRSTQTGIAALPHFPNLSVLPCGPMPPNPLELLSTNRFSELLEDASRKYDAVLIDTPAADLFADAQALSVRAHAALLVAARGHTGYRAIQALHAELTRTGVGIVGSVLNEPTAPTSVVSKLLARFESQPRPDEEPKEADGEGAAWMRRILIGMRQGGQANRDGSDKAKPPVPEAEVGDFT